MDHLATLQPEKVFYYFESITKIPHGSFHEEKLADYLVSFANARGLSCVRDEFHNVLICKNAASGFEASQPVLLQGHIDMVCEKTANSNHDFDRQPLELIVKDDWISADGTTLGADDGIAAAMMLAILDSEVSSPALECLFTVQEEVGLTGAGVFDYSNVHAKRMINLDSEDEGRACVGCAGGVRCDFQRNLTYLPNRAPLTVSIVIQGLAGGHSGMEIDQGRINANRALGHVLEAAYKVAPFYLVSISGGTKDNAIPRESSAVIACDIACFELLKSLAEEEKEHFSGEDRNATICVSLIENAKETMSMEDTSAILELVNDMEDGVIRMSEDFCDLVETSANLGIICGEHGKITLSSSQRSIVAKQMQTQKEMNRRLAAKTGFSIAFRGEYPGWEFQPDSPIRQLYVQTYQAMFGEVPIVETIHAGVECGIISAKIPGLDAISIGPDMEHVHTPNERLCISSVGRVYRHLLLMLEKLK